MTLTILPAKLSGTVTPPPSKSQAHRFLIAAALAGAEDRVHHLADSEDIRATRRCMAALLAPAGGELPLLDCGESGSTLRFLIPVALALRGGGRFTGRGRLMERPQTPYFDLFREKGIAYGQENGVLTLQGELQPGTYSLPGNVSSQFVTGLLYALPLLPGDSKIMLTSKLESLGYVEMTLKALEKFDVQADTKDYVNYYIPGNQTYRPAEVTVEADWSQAGFWYAARFLGSQVETLGLDPHSPQGDRVLEEYYGNLMGPGDLDLDVSDCPDLAPPLAVMAALRTGRTTRLVNAARLRIKESDRLAAIREELCKLGGRVTEGSDFLEIEGQDTLPGGVTVDAHNDHRIAMMLAIAATRCQRRITLTGAESVNKSYPSFWEEYARLGGQIH